jgi:hypothetical protein
MERVQVQKGWARFQNQCVQYKICASPTSHHPSLSFIEPFPYLKNPPIPIPYLQALYQRRENIGARSPGNHRDPCCQTVVADRDSPAQPTTAPLPSFLGGLAGRRMMYLVTAGFLGVFWVFRVLCKRRWELLHVGKK